MSWPKRVFKYPFPTQDSIKLPPGSVPVHVNYQFGKVQVWAEVPIEPWVGREEVEVAVIVTGVEVPADHVFLGTLLLVDGQLVMHFYWRQP